MNQQLIALSCTSEQNIETVKKLSLLLNLPLVNNNEHLFSLLLTRTDTHWELRQPGKNTPGAIYVDFVTGHAAHRRKYGGGKGQALARAIGMKKLTAPHVIDTTAGLGRDSFVLASLGAQVTMLERNSVIHVLLQDGILRAQLNEETADISQRMKLENTDSIEFLQQKNLNKQFDVIYLDPMFPRRQSSAHVKKEMQTFHKLIGEDIDKENLLTIALNSGVKRVVVKRPMKSPPLGNHKPHACISGKTTRYDLYINS